MKDKKGMELEEGEVLEVPSSKKEKRASKKQRKLIAEYEMTLSNDKIKRPGTLLDAPGSKRLKVDPKGKEVKLSPEEFNDLKKRLKERKRILTQLPRFILQGAGVTSTLQSNHDVREPIFMSDVQQLLLYSLGGNQLVCPPTRWCSLQKANRLTHVLALIVEGISTSDFVCYEHLFPKLTEIFSDRVEVMAPACYGRNVIAELSCIPLSNAQKEEILRKHGSIEEAVSRKEMVQQYREIFPTIGDNISLPSLSVNADLPVTDRFPRTYLLMSLGQMMFEGYPLPFKGRLALKNSGYKLSKSLYKEVTPQSPMFSIDCEMCITASNPSELTRVAVVNENLEVVYETYVKPKEQITNYLTKFSGITPEKLKDVTTTLEDVQEALSKLLPEDAIWIGQSLNCDLHALKMMHPYVIDTSLVFNLSGVPGRKAKLAHMAETFLNEEIQANKEGHCPIEDARAAMKLVKLKLAEGYLFGDNSVASSEDLKIPESVLATSIFNRTYKFQKTVAVIGPETVLKEYEKVTIAPPDKTAFTPIKISKNKHVIEKMKEVGTSHQLTMAHIDISSKVEGTDEETKTAAFQKLDEWCDTVYKHCSLNGMCVVIFSGPKSLPESPSDDSNNDSAANDDSVQPEMGFVPASNQLAAETKKSKKPCQNGVCFIRINTLKV